MRGTSLSALALIAVLTSLFALTAGGRARTVDERVLFAQTESLLLRGSFAIPQTIERGHFYGRIGVDGRPYGATSPGWPLLALPFCALGHQLAGLWQLDEPTTQALAEITCSWLNALAAAIAVALLWLVLADAGYDRRRIALPVAMAAGLTTPLWVYAGSLFTEPVSAAALVGAVWGSVRWARDRRRWPLLVAGMCLALLPLVKLSHVVLVPVVALAVVLHSCERGERLRVATWLLAPALVAVIAHLSLNAVQFGSPFTTGYPASWNNKALNTFRAPFWVGLFGFLLSPGKGVAVFAPLAVVGAAFVGLMARRHQLLALLAVAPLATLLAFYVTYTQWEGGYCFGPRYLVPALPLLLLPLAELMRHLIASGRRRVLAGLLLLTLAGGWVQFTGVTTNWFAAPRDRALYYDDSFDYRLTYAPVLELSRRVGRGWAQISRARRTRARLLNHWLVHLIDAKAPANLGSSIGLAGLAGMLAGALLARAALVADRRRQP